MKKLLVIFVVLAAIVWPFNISCQSETKNANKPHLYGQLLPENFEPFPKNPHIAQIFTQIGRSEELGTGVRNVYKYSKAYSGSEDIQFLEEDIFITKVPLIPKFIDVGKDVGKDVGGNRLDIIIELLSKNNKLTVKEISHLLNTSERTIDRDIEKLKKGGRLKRIGGRKDGHWEIQR